MQDNLAQEARGTAYGQFFLRPQDTLALDGSYFTPGFGGNHELKFGVGYRGIDNSSQRTNPGIKAQGRFNTTSTRARFFRDAANATEATYLSAHLGDTFTARPAHGEPGRALGQPEGQEGRVHHPGQPAPPEPAAGARLRGRRRHDDRVEQHLAPLRLHLRARRGAQDRAARLVRALRGPAAGGRRRLGQRARDVLPRVRLGRPQRRRGRPDERGRPVERAWLRQHRPHQPGRDRRVAEPDRPRLPRQHRPRGGHRPRPRAGAEPGAVGRLHLAQVDRPDLDPAPVRHLLVQLDRHRPLGLRARPAVLPERLLRDALRPVRGSGQPRDRRHLPDEPRRATRAPTTAPSSAW